MQTGVIKLEGHMFAKNLEIVLAYLCEKGDVSHSLPQEFGARFEALRRYGELPRGRERRDQLLTSSQIASAILSLATVHPNWAGHAARILSGLRPIGGVDACFFGTSTLQESIACILTDATARNSVIRLSVSAAEAAINSNGYATLSYEIGGTRRRTFYGRAEAPSLMQPGAERDFDHHQPYSPVSRETAFNRTFFLRLAEEMQSANAFPTPAGDGSEYNAEEAQQERYRKLGARRGSRYLNIGVDNQVTWPAKEMLINFDKYDFVLMPKTQDHVASIHIDLTANQLTDRDAITVVNRFLSIMTWCDDQFAIAQDGWSGNPVPVPVRKRDLAFTTTYQWIFDRKIPSSEEARRALALYRDGRNAEQNFMVSYAVLNFFRIIEIRNHSRGAVKKWFRDNFAIVRNETRYRDAFSRFAEICADEQPHEYLYKACRVAVSHAGQDSKSDPDDANEVTRLHKAAEVLRLLARHFILTDLGVSEVLYSAE